MANELRKKIDMLVDKQEKARQDGSVMNNMKN